MKGKRIKRNITIPKRVYRHVRRRMRARGIRVIGRYVDQLVEEEKIRVANTNHVRD